MILFAHLDKFSFFLHGLAAVDVDSLIMHFTVIKAIAIIVTSNTVKPSFRPVMIGVQAFVLT